MRQMRGLPCTFFSMGSERTMRLSLVPLFQTSHRAPTASRPTRLNRLSQFDTIAFDLRATASPEAGTATNRGFKAGSPAQPGRIKSGDAGPALARRPAAKGGMGRRVSLDNQVPASSPPQHGFHLCKTPGPKRPQTPGDAAAFAHLAQIPFFQGRESSLRTMS